MLILFGRSRIVGLCVQEACLPAVLTAVSQTTRLWPAPEVISPSSNIPKGQEVTTISPHSFKEGDNYPLCKQFPSDGCSGSILTWLHLRQLFTSSFLTCASEDRDTWFKAWLAGATPAAGAEAGAVSLKRTCEQVWATVARSILSTSTDVQVLHFDNCIAFEPASFVSSCAGLYASKIIVLRRLPSASPDCPRPRSSRGLDDASLCAVP